MRCGINSFEREAIESSAKWLLGAGGTYLLFQPSDHFEEVV